MRYLVLGLILLSLMVYGCTFLQPPQNTTNETPPPPPPPPPKAPVISIMSPTEGEAVMTSADTGDATVTISTQNLVLKSPGGAAKAGEGHFRVTVDNEAPKTVTSKTYLISGLALGEHTVKVELLNNDRTQYSPAISKKVTFTIEKEKPKEYEPQGYNVSITDTGFYPSSLTVKVGDSVTWTNNGKMPQTATCFQDGRKVFDTQTLGVGKSATIKMDSIFECEYYSSLFRALTGSIKVESNGTIEE